MQPREPAPLVATSLAPVGLVVNTHSRQGADLFVDAQRVLHERGIPLSAAYALRQPRELREVARKLVAEGERLIIVGGGDGTLSTVVDELAYRDVVLGILPLGTANTFARTLDIPLDLDGAVDVIARGHLREVDLGKIGDDYFTSEISIGIATEMTRHTSRRLKRVLGILAYGLTGLRIALGHRPFRCTLRLDDTVETFETHQLLIANGPYVGIRRLIPGTTLDDERMVVLAVKSRNPWDLARLAFTYVTGLGSVFPETFHWQTREVTVETDPRQDIDVDGEVNTTTPARVSIAPRALKVLAPPRHES
ncbi:MAG TPA: YegS/Rv2252/BmrU family lipid kinase [Chloroflexota bacterium]|nr:YegS/Rv2252/BmrU family lipid kinase [Chloroflexota bacterium]